MVHPAGIPNTETEFNTPVGLLSGTAILTGPEQNCTVEDPDTTFSLTGGSLRHILIEDGVTTGAGGVAFTIAVAKLLQPVAVEVPITVYGV